MSVIGLREEDIILSVSKQFFAYGLGNALTFPFAVGATAVLHKDRPTPESISRLIENHRVTALVHFQTEGEMAPPPQAVMR